MNKYEQDQMCNEAVAKIEEMTKDKQWQRRDNYCLRIQKALQYKGTNDNEDIPSILVNFENEIRKEILPEDSVVLPKSEYADLKEFADKYIESLHKDKCLGTDSVVLTREEYDNIYEQAEANVLANIADGGTSCHWCIEQHEKKASKATAEKIKGFIFSKLNEATDDLTRLILREIYWQVDGFAKQFDVETDNSVEHKEITTEELLELGKKRNELKLAKKITVSNNKDSAEIKE